MHGETMKKQFKVLSQKYHIIQAWSRNYLKIFWTSIRFENTSWKQRV